MTAIRAWLCVLLAAGFSCAESGEPAQPVADTARGEPGPAGPARQHKPRAPIDVAISARRLQGSEYEVSLTGTPETNVERVSLELLLPDTVTLVKGSARAGFGKTAAGATRELIATLRLDGAGAEVLASARVRVIDGLEPNRMAAAWLGTPTARPVPVHTLALPSGELIDEVGP